MFGTFGKEMLDGMILHIRYAIVALSPFSVLPVVVDYGLQGTIIKMKLCF